MPTFPRTKTAQLSQFELRSVWQRGIGSEEAEERECGGGGRANSEERVRESNERRKEGVKRSRRQENKEERESLCSGSGSTSFLAPQWETMKY